MPMPTYVPDEGAPYGRLQNGQPRKAPFKLRRPRGGGVGMNKLPAKYNTIKRKFKPFMEDGRTPEEVQELAAQAETDKQEDAVEPSETTTALAAPTGRRCTSIEAARAILGPKIRVIGTAEGLRLAKFTWMEHVQSILDIARNEDLDPDVRMRARKEIERLAREADTDSVVEKMLAARNRGDKPGWKSLVEDAIAKQVAGGNLEAAKTAINAGLVEGWTPEQGPTTATQINVYGDISADKKARLDELDLLIARPALSIIDQTPATDMRPGDVPEEIIVEVPDSGEPEEPAVVLVPSEEQVDGSPAEQE
jgi:hypothetical protein